MSELTIGQIVKIIMAALVIAAVIYGAIISYQNYLSPYFDDLGFEEKRNLDSQYYKELVSEKDKVASLSLVDEEQYIIINKVKTSYYWKKGRIYLEREYWFDKEIGKTDKNGRILLDSSALEKYSDLSVIDGSEKIGIVFYKKASENEK